MTEGPARKVCCAIYTRKSTDEGLEQSFNSLDAQREACAAYAASQRHEGWEVLPQFYDDGGYSGGTLDRPALKQLLADVSAGNVDVIILYKIDRLTRSLADFARIVDVLDRALASFVSVTQAFNTTTSMGRLTLNVLLSFAQFEREVGAERVRDKIAASKRKGMWMGGVCPLGYDVRNRALVVNETEACVVRQIFDIYLALGSVRSLEDDLRNRGVCSKLRVSRAGVEAGGNSISRGALYVMLRNVLYVGQVSHKGSVFPGQHEGIVDPEIFERVQRLLNLNINCRRDGGRTSPSALLTGRLWDEHGRPMSPTHTTKGSRRYHYYQSRDGEPSSLKPRRVSAGELDSVVTARVQAFLLDPASIHDALEPVAVGAAALSAAIDRANSFAGQLDAPNEATSEAMHALVQRVQLGAASVIVEVNLGVLLNAGHPAVSIQFEIPARLIRRTKEIKLCVAPHRSARTYPDAGLIKLIVKSRQVRSEFEECREISVAQLSAKLGYQLDYCTVLLKLGYLSPKIISSILEGRQPVELTRQRLARFRNLPIEWAEQERALDHEDISIERC